jgi:hypothetical protein
MMNERKRDGDGDGMASVVLCQFTQLFLSSALGRRSALRLTNSKLEN